MAGQKKLTSEQRARILRARGDAIPSFEMFERGDSPPQALKRLAHIIESVELEAIFLDDEVDT